MLKPIDTKSIVYSERDAIAEVARVDVEQPIINRKNHRWNVFLGTIVWVICPISVIALTLYLCNGGPLAVSRPHIPVIIMGVITFWLASCVYEAYSREVLPQYQWYTANAEYYRITKGYTPLKHALLYEGSQTYTLHVTMENENHEVFEDFVLCPQLEGITKTDIKTMTVDLQNGKVYLPYTH